MRICVPVESNEGLTARVNGHFGSAPYFLIYDTEKSTYEITGNSDEDHVHGTCQPLEALRKQGVDVVVCMGMGARAVHALNAGGIRAYRAVVETAAEATRRYTEGALEEMTVADCCTEHKCR